MIHTIFCAILASFQTRQPLIRENLVLRHQLQVLNRGGKRSRLKDRDRIVWIPWCPKTQTTFLLQRLRNSLYGVNSPLRFIALVSD